MSLSITYTTTYANWTVSDYLADWAGYFGDADHRIGDTGGFFVDG
jgi:heme acquisition protein HasA